jgi:UDP-N-acetylglucosamine 2-epimerase
MKILSVLGARPNFVKMTPFINSVEKTKHEHVIVHSGQHYDHNLSQVFFDEMKYKEPDYYLEVGSGTHGYQTGEILKKVEEVIVKEEPDIVIVPGDTNTNMSGALAAVKLHINVGHIEAGLRSYDKTIPEEINRIIIDHCSNFLFCPTNFSVDFLRKEGITEGVFMVGDTMFELYYHLQEKISKVKLPFELPDNFILCTVHRACNTIEGVIERIFDNLMKIETPILLPLHPRTKKKLVELNLLEKVEKKINIIEPVGFFEFSKLLKDSIAVITDSGGVQKESYWNKKPCITIRDTTEWIDTVEKGGNILVEPKEIKEKTEWMLSKDIDFDEKLYGFTDTSKRIIKILEENLEK